MATAKQLDLAKATVDTFKPHIGSKFETTLFAGTSEEGIKSDGVTVELELVDCEDRGEIQCPEGPDSDKMLTRKRFSVVFSGPENFPFFDGVYQLHHAELGEIPAIALSRDADKDGKVLLLTATFS
ncbi:MAG: hypothetical protein VX464_19570 [Pseudomonadota bacterium]|nr:hypothetical protein [Pseudomonadota bacterium]